MRTPKMFTRELMLAAAIAAATLLGGASTVYAETSQSTNYMVNEVQFGVGGARENCSTLYCADMSAGDTAVGETSSTNYSARAGFNTTTDPYLEVWTEGGTVELGTLDVSATATATNEIKVRSYLSSGYVIQITGDAPSQGTHELNTLTTQSTSQPGAEQFGINLADNTSPDIGAAAIQVPSNDFSYGTVDGAYGTPDLFKYIDGDVVARSLSSSGETDYTMSLIINISNVTPGGKYTGSLSAVVVPVF